MYSRDVNYKKTGQTQNTVGQNKSCESVTAVVNVHSAAPTASRSSDRPHNGSRRFVLVHCSVTWMDEAAGRGGRRRRVPSPAPSCITLCRDAGTPSHNGPCLGTPRWTCGDKPAGRESYCSLGSSINPANHFVLPPCQYLPPLPPFS